MGSVRQEQAAALVVAVDAQHAKVRQLALEADQHGFTYAKSALRDALDALEDAAACLTHER